MDNFTSLPAFAGGIVSGLPAPAVRRAGWRVAFLLGLVDAPLVHAALFGELEEG